MKILILLTSYLPFPVLHFISTILYFWIYVVFGYRKKVVRENLLNAFPEKTPGERSSIERKFYRNFCDMMVETIKTTTISKEELNRRFVFKTPANVVPWVEQKLNLNGISSHLGNWEWLCLSLNGPTGHHCYGVYKPLSNKKLDAFMVKSRARFGVELIPITKIRKVFKATEKQPYLLGLLSDQAPHDYDKAFEIPFLNQKTFYVPGPGMLTVKHDLTPIWGWVRRTGRSKYEWGLDPIHYESVVLTDADRTQIQDLAETRSMPLEDAEKAYRVVKEYSRLLEEMIRKQPEDWLWSHRRWKTR